MSDDRNATLARIEKLVRLASSPNENEARTAAFLACKLMREHELMPVGSKPDGEQGEELLFWKRLARNYRAQLLELERQQAEMPRGRSSQGGRASSDGSTGDVVRLRSRFAGICKECRAAFCEGDIVYWRKGAGSVCSGCRARGVRP